MNIKCFGFLIKSCLIMYLFTGLSIVFSEPLLNSLSSKSHADKVQLILKLTEQPDVNFKLEKATRSLIIDVKALPAKTYKNLLSFKNRGISKLHTKMIGKDTVRLSIVLDKHYPFDVYAGKEKSVIIDIYDQTSNPQAVQKAIIASKKTNKNNKAVVVTPAIATRPPPRVKEEKYKVVSAEDFVKKDKSPKWNTTSKKQAKKTEVKPAVNKDTSLQKTSSLTPVTAPKIKKTVPEPKITNPKIKKKEPAKLIVPDIPKPVFIKKMLVIIDPGHGGKDGGAVGPSGTREKDVVLQIAKRLKNRIDKMTNMRAELTRTTDKFIPLRERTRIARKKKADLFISIHADAFLRKNVRGSSVFILSTRGASSEAARQLAKNENAVDVRYGVNFKNYDPDISKVLIDIQQSATIESSYVLAKKTLGQLKGIGKVHKRYVERAGFAVLKSPEIPSILVETAFISNPTEEKKLRSPSYQEEIAAAIASGVKKYMSESLPQHILLGQQN